MNSFVRWAVLAAIISSAASFRLSLLGENTNDDRIYSGKNASLGQFPYQAALRRPSTPGGITYSHFCGGSIIGKRWVLTAAHCVANPSSWPRIYVGSIGIDGGSMYEIERIVLHPQHDVKLLKADIALLRTKKPIEFGESVKPIPLGKRFVDAGVRSIASGWGRTRANELAKTLQFMGVRTMSNVDCAAHVDDGHQHRIYDSTVCAVGASRDQAICAGDSGGPLVANGQLIGVISWSYKSCAAGYPDGYTRVSEYTEWIQVLTNIIAV